MATGQLSRDQLKLALLKQGVSESHATDATLYPTFVPEHRGAGSQPPMPPPKKLPEPKPGDKSSHELSFHGKIAEGGMGEILLATQSGIRRDVAVKTLKQPFLEPAFALRLLREARVLGLLEHPNIVPLYALHTDERNAPALVMKRIEGVSWRTLIRDPEEAPFRAQKGDALGLHLEIFMRVCDAVQYAHSRGVLHLDLKPDNIMLGAFREVYLVDWGVAVSVSDKHRGWLPLADEVTEIVGTPAYLAPEMVPIDGSTIDARSDVYLLGGILYEILMKEPPHKGKNLHEVLHLVQTAEAPKLPSSVPGELRRLVQKAMSPRQDSRFDSVEELRDAVAAFIKHRSALELANSAHDALKTLTGLVAAQAPTASGHRIQATLGSEAQEVLRLFGRCRYGFAEALRQWPDSRRARKGQLKLLTLMAEYHLGRGEAASAEALLKELDELEDTEHIASLRKEAARQRRNAAALERFEREESPEAGQGVRARIVLAIGVLVTALSTAGWVGQRFGYYAYEWWHTAVFTSAVLAFSMLVGFFRRDDLLSYRRGRRITWAMLTIGVMALGLRLTVTYLGLVGLETLALELGVLAGGATVIGLLADPRMIRIAPVFAFFAALTIGSPANSLLWTGLASLSGAAVLARTWLASEDETEHEGASQV